MAIGGALAECVTVGDPKHLHPVPAKLVASMQSKGMAVTDPILIRVCKKRMSLRTGSVITHVPCQWRKSLNP